MMEQFLAAMIGTIAFSLLFSVPSRYYPWCGIVGGIGWLCYLISGSYVGNIVGCFFATCVVVLLCRFFATRMRCPVTIFLISGIFPLVPGAGIYWTAYYTIMEQYSLASAKGFETIKYAVAIVLGIIFIFEIPQGFFKRMEHKEIGQ
ncbi:threonine/serine exporter family protein [Anaerosporobacter faecicola]|uniref:threonine/serine exporter family protein n=1 Tax=Anaerosporobacter faecicola TaxID=2718714 RepID=UPI001438721D|nr:threonine/serine exporter family protein [Anaerosporobacter faecicola]